MGCQEYRPDNKRKCNPQITQIKEKRGAGQEALARAVSRNNRSNLKPENLNAKNLNRKNLNLSQKLGT